MFTKMNTRIILILVSLLIVSAFSYSVLKAEDLKEKQTLLKNISTENDDYSSYRQTLLQDMDVENEKHKRTVL